MPQLDAAAVNALLAQAAAKTPGTHPPRTLRAKPAAVLAQEAADRKQGRECARDGGHWGGMTTRTKRGTRCPR
jgi:hypothetical protein